MSKISPILAKVSDIPKGDGPFVQLNGLLIQSPVWKYKSSDLSRLIDFLLIEHVKHGLAENGSLKATYKQLMAYGIGKQYISLAIQEGEAFGLLECQRNPRKSLAESYPNEFRLTFLKYKLQENGQSQYVAPTNEWKMITEVKALEISKEFTLRRANYYRKKKTKLSRTSILNTGKK